MRPLSLIVLLGASLALATCGGSDDSSAGSDLPTQVELTKPNIQPPDTLPKELVIRDLSTGADPAARNGDELTVEYYGVNEVGQLAGSSWNNPTLSQLRTRLGSGKYFDGFEEGLEGMKVGSRRELLIPAKLTEGFGALFYIVDLLEIDRKGKCWWAQPLGEEPPSPAKGDKACESRVQVL